MPRGRRLRAAAWQGTARRSRSKLHAAASRPRCVAQHAPADGRSPQWRGIAATTAHRDGAAIDRDVEPRAAARGVCIDHPASDQGGCRCVIRVLLPTI